MKTEKANMIFKNDGSTFSGLYAAQAWCSENGYSYGSLCAPKPTAIIKGDVSVAKWKNLTARERKDVDGIFYPLIGTYRDGDIQLEIYGG